MRTRLNDASLILVSIYGVKTMKSFLAKFQKSEQGSKELVVTLLLLAVVAVPLVLWTRNAGDRTQEKTQEQMEEVLQEGNYDEF